jgi:PAS domain S-box-containing protein
MREVAPLRILHLEDERADVELVRATLLSDGLSCEIRNVSDRAEYIAALDGAGIDLILSDFALPGFDGLSALDLAQEKMPEVPFILLSGTLGEDAAIRALRSGATDYVLKQRLSRLTPAVRRALVEAQERRRTADAERSLRDSEERFRRVFEESPVGIATIDRDLRLLNANEAFCRMLKRSAEDLAGADFAALVVEADRAEWVDEAQRMLDGEIDTFRMERRYSSGGDEILWGDVTVCTIRRGADRETLGLAVVQDITQRKSLEEQLRHSQKMEAIGLLAGGVAHDFNNLLSVISGYGEMLVADPSLEGCHRGRVEQILRSAERAASLTRQLLAFSRKQVIEPKVLELNSLLGETNKLLQRLIGENIDLVTSMAEDLGRIKADPGQIEQIIVNLVVNARDAMPHGGKVMVETSNVWLDGSDPLLDGAMPPGKYVKLAITDSGIGMSPEVQARIFEPFFTTKGVGKGTGLGLATVYGIVSQSGGYICVSSEPGRGTMFTIFLPMVEDLPASAGVEDQDALRPGTETVLVVEDEEAVRELIGETLETYGYRVIAAGDFDSALEAATQHRGEIHLLVTDVILPGKGGPEVAQEVTALRPETKVLYVSGYTDDAIGRHGVLDAGVAFLQKPFTLTALARKVRQVLDSGSGTQKRKSRWRRRETGRRRPLSQDRPDAS